MKNFSLSLFFITFACLYTQIYAASPSLPGQQNKPAPTFLQMMDTFFHVFPDPSQPEHALLPSLDTAITKVYSDGLHLPDSMIANIRRFYAYLQGLAIDNALSDLQNQINTAENAVSVADANDPNLPTLKHNVLSLQQTFATKKAALDSTIIDLCTKTSVWQQHLQVFIGDSFTYELSLLNSVHQQEKEIFTYLPTFETAYYSDGYTQLRNGAELVRIFLVLTDTLRQRAIAQCPEWNNITDPSKLYDAIETFKEGDFYGFAHTFDLLSSNTGRYSFPQSATLYNADGTISQGFHQYFVLDENKKLSVTPHGALGFGVDENNHPYFTALGNFMFTYNPGDAHTPPGLTHKPAFDKLFQDSPTGPLPKPLYLELMGFSAIKFLNNGTQYLFNTANLEDTMNQLEKIGEDHLLSFPNIIPYMPSDYLYLEDINQLKPLVDPGNADSTAIQSFWSHLWHSITHAFTAAADAIKNAFNTIVHSIGDFFVNAWHAVVHFSEGLYYETGIACAFQNINYAESKEKGGKMFNAVAGDIQKMGDDMQDIINATADIAKTTMKVIGTVVGQVNSIIFQDPSLAEDLTGLFTSVADAFIDSAANYSNMLVETGTDIVKLSYEAVTIIGTSVFDVLENTLSGGQAGFRDFLAQGNYFAKDIVNSMLSAASLYIKQFTDAFKSLMQAIAYLASSITDIIADVAGVIGALNALSHGENAAAAFNSWKGKVDEHRRLIVGVVTTTVILVGSLAMVPFTGGSSLAIGLGVTMAVLGAGMMAMNVVGDAQQDTDAIHNKTTQQEMLTKYKQYVPDNEKVTQICQVAALNEMTAKLAAQEQNYEQGLVYFKNYLNNHFNNLTSTAAFGLSSFYNELTMTDTTRGTMIADPGFLVGIKTDRMALNPAQGFLIYNKQRNSFAQEIADAPTQVVATTESQSITLNPALTQFWLNQKDLSNIPIGQNLLAEVRWRSIYETEGAFYIGLFMTERSLDIDLLHALHKNYEDAQNLGGVDAGLYLDKTWENLDTFNRDLLTFDHLARCFVMYRENPSFQPMLGLYQHEGQGDGWLNKNVAPVKYQRGVWYRMRIQLSGDQTSVKCWQEGDQEPAWQASTVTPQAPALSQITPLQLPNSQDSFSVKNQPAPTPAPTPADNNNSKSGSGLWVLSAAQPSQQAQQENWKLSAQTGQGTQVQNANGTWTLSTEQKIGSNGSTKYMGSLGFVASGAAVEYEILYPKTVIEVTPTRKAQDDQVDATFKNAHLPITETEREKEWVIKLQQEVQPTFGGVSLQPLSHEDISQGIFIYTTNKTGLNPDYIVFGASVDAPTKTAQGLGMSPSNNPSIVVSLVTGKAYDTNWNVLQQCSGVLAAFESAHPVSTSTDTLLTQASSAYFASLIAPITFSNTTLTGLSQAFQNNGAAYSGTPLTPLLTSGFDYYVFAQLDDNNHYTQYGLLPNDPAAQINGLISLVSGNVYGLYAGEQRITSLKEQSPNVLTLKVLTNDSLYSSLYTSYQSRLGSTLYNTIEQQTIAYQVALQKANQPAPQPAPAPTPAPSSQTTQPEEQSTFWKLMHGEDATPEDNFNNLIEDSGDFAQLGVPG